jgi:hypothetical protein
MEFLQKSRMQEHSAEKVTILFLLLKLWCTRDIGKNGRFSSNIDLISYNQLRDLLFLLSQGKCCLKI